MRPEWLRGTNLTRFDVPGLCNQIWVDSAGIACTDTDQMAGCVLGGGTAVNAGLWWKVCPFRFYFASQGTTDSSSPPRRIGMRTSPLAGRLPTLLVPSSACSTASPAHGTRLRMASCTARRVSTSWPAVLTRLAGRRLSPMRLPTSRTAPLVTQPSCSTMARETARSLLISSLLSLATTSSCGPTRL